jgi:glucan 1,3-beta-glucosidase
LDALNQKKTGKGYDEAYLEEVRDKEQRMEKERRKGERRAVRDEQARERELESARQRRAQVEEELREADLDKRREEERARRREEKSRLKLLEKERQEQIRLAALRGERTRTKPKKQTKPTEEYEYTDSEDNGEIVRPREERKSGQKKYSRIVKPDEKRRRRDHSERQADRKKHRVISGPYVEDGRTDKVYRHEKKQSGTISKAMKYLTNPQKKKRLICKCNPRLEPRTPLTPATGIGIMVIAVILIIGIAVAVKATQKNPTVQSAGSSSSAKPANSNLNGISPSSIPASAKGGYLDPFSWYDTTDFNVTYTDATVGGLSIMGLDSSWDDNVQANPNVPSLTDAFPYGRMPIRGMNVGGWLSIEPFITPSFFARYSTREGVVDEYTLCAKLGSNALATIEPHYSSFVNKQTFSDIRAAGFDHVRIPFSYWAVTTYPGDPYVAQTSWRYLLRGIEYARQNGLRVNLDLHGAPGSQNGWNHSGRQGVVGWLNGTDGTLNGQRTIDIHNQMSQFFSQPRYKNVVTMYGLVNEPRMTGLDTTVVTDWSNTAIRTIRNNNITAVIVFGDGFLGLDKWQGKLQTDSNLLLDVHQYVIFNNNQIALDHSDKLTFACKGWTAQMLRSQNRATGFGPTMCGEWSQADTDCAQYLNNVGMGSRWEGNLNTGDPNTQVLTPQCPTKNNPQCECTDANNDPSRYSATYKQWLLAFAEAQMESFEQGWGWFYWTWDTENAVQWSWKKGMSAGILPQTTTDRVFNCNSSAVPDYGKLGLAENY